MSTSNGAAFGIWSHIILGFVAGLRIWRIPSGMWGHPTMIISRFPQHTRAIDIGEYHRANIASSRGEHIHIRGRIWRSRIGRCGRGHCGRLRFPT